MKMLADYAATVRACGPVPPNVYEAVQRYIEDGIEPGGFVRACLENDLRIAVSRADSTNATHLKPIVQMLNYAIPSIAFGNETRVRSWLAGGWKHAETFKDTYAVVRAD